MWKLINTILKVNWNVLKFRLLKNFECGTTLNTGKPHKKVNKLKMKFSEVANLYLFEIYKFKLSF